MPNVSKITKFKASELNFKETRYLNVSLDLLLSAGHLLKGWSFIGSFISLCISSKPITASNVAAVIIVCL